MCFSVIIGRTASATGHVMLAANDDWPGCPGHVHHVPRKSWTPSDRFMTVKGVPIPQASVTFGYTYSSAAYETGSRPVSWADGVNDQRVAVSMQGVYAFANYQRSGDLLEADDLVILMLERGKTARDAIRLAGDLIAQYGFSVSSIPGAEGTVCMAVADPQEGFFLELGPGGYWCARRVDDDKAECRPNCFGIGEIDFADSARFLCSPGLYELAIEKGCINSGEPLNFTLAFGGDYSELNPGYGGALNPVNTFRKWGTLHRLGGLDIPLDAQIYDCRPLRAVTRADLMELMRDTLAGTPYDLALRPEAGPHHNPFWMEISTSIAQSGTVICMVADLSSALPDALGSSIWFAFGNACLSPFIPCYTGGCGLPAAYQRGQCGDFRAEDAWWNFHETAQLCERNYEAIAPTEIIPVYHELEAQFARDMAQAEHYAAAIFSQSPENALASLVSLTDRQALYALDLSMRIARKIKGKYLCNTILNWI